MSTLKRRAFFACLTLHRTSGIAGVLAFTLLFVPPASAVEPAKDPAHSIANRFAEDAQRAEAQRKEAARKQAAKAKAQKAYEAEMLARARAESEERRKLEEQAARLDALRAEREARDAEAERQRAEKARLIEAARETEKAQTAEEARKAEEARLAEVARKAAEETKRAEAERAAEERRRADIAARAARRVEEARKAEEVRKAEDVRRANDALRLAAERAASEEAARVESDKRAAEARRAIERATSEETRRIADIEGEAEIARVAERLRRIRNEDLAKRTGIAAAPANGPTIPVSGPVTGPTEERKLEPSSGRGRVVEHDERRDVPLQPPRARAGSPLPSYQSPEPKLAPESRYDGRVTVLLQMEPRHRRGRHYESMDPVLCTAEGCYVSNGSVQPASFLYGRGAMRFGNAISRRAGACNHAYTCIFRNVDLGALPADVQPVDIRVIRHDRRDPERVEALSTCRVTMGDRLTCTDAIEGDGYTMWVISEADVEGLPPHAFDRALGSGLADAERADADPELMDPKLMHPKFGAPHGRW